MDPAGHKVIDTPTSTYWIDGEGILCAISKKNDDVNLDIRKKLFDEFRQTTGGKKMCMMIDITNSSPVSRETRNYNAKQLPKAFKAIAFICRSPLDRMLAHLFLGINSDSLPTKIFSKEADARVWLRQYL
jgi:hypothetical protein